MAPSTGSVPPPLPPSVEEAYRRKCIQLKQRLNDVEEANDASRARLSRLHRAIDKMRLERAFLLEQLAKRTSTNVEDSDGSPSPPPTPKEKPLRTKRGHRKPSFLNNVNDGLAGSAFVQQSGPVTLSPSGSDAFSHTNPELQPPASSNPSSKRPLPSSNGNASLPANHSTTPPPSKPKSAFDVYAKDLRDVVIVQNRKAYQEGSWNPDRALAQGWQNLDDNHKEEYQRRYDALKKSWDAEKEGDGNGAEGKVAGDEDVEMGDGEEERAEEESAGGGFTAVNRD